MSGMEMTVPVSLEEEEAMLAHFQLSRGHDSSYLFELANRMEDWCGHKGTIGDFGLMKVIPLELPRGSLCWGCPNLEMETEYRGWCTLEAPVTCHKGESTITIHLPSIHGGKKDE